MKIKGKGGDKKKETTVKEAIRDLLKVNPDGGQVTVDELNREFPQMNRSELVAELRDIPNGHFVIGRRGFPSRFFYGEAAKEVAQAAKARKQYAGNGNGNGNGNRVTNRVTTRKAINRNGGRNVRDEDEMTSELPLRITIGDVGATIPIRVKIAPVEIAAGE